jgi:hypothetical protein
VRFSHYLASGALAASFALSACAGTGSQAVPGAQSVMPAGHQTNGIHLMLLRPAAKGCTAQFAFCVTVTPGDPGPYYEFCGNPSCSGSAYNITGTSHLTMTRSGKNMDRQWPSYLSPNPGNPIQEYISEHKTITGGGGNPKLTATNVICSAANSSQCTTYTVGLIPGS